MRLIIVRHGRTDGNEAGIIQGQSNSQLSKEGDEQAKKLAKRLEKEKIDLVFSSDLDRARHTAERVVQFHDVKIVYTSLLRERSFGKFEGRKKVDINAELNGADFFNHPECEKDERIMERAKKFLEGLDKYKDKTILIVAHGGINIALIANLLGKSFNEVVEMGRHHNTGLNIIEDGKMICFNCNKHLE